MKDYTKIINRKIARAFLKQRKSNYFRDRRSPNPNAKNVGLMVSTCRQAIPTFQKEFYRNVGRDDNQIKMDTRQGNFSPAILPLLQIICDEDGQINPSEWMRENKIRAYRTYKDSCRSLELYFARFKLDRSLELLTNEAIWERLKVDGQLMGIFIEGWLQYYFGGLPAATHKLPEIKVG